VELFDFSPRSFNAVRASALDRFAVNKDSLHFAELKRLSDRDYLCLVAANSDPEIVRVFLESV